MDYDYLKYKKILIVDDEADLREMVTSILEQDGFKTIKTAGTVAEALKICRDWKPEGLSQGTRVVGRSAPPDNYLHKV